MFSHKLIVINVGEAVGFLLDDKEATKLEIESSDLTKGINSYNPFCINFIKLNIKSVIINHTKDMRKTKEQFI